VLALLFLLFFFAWLATAAVLIAVLLNDRVNVQARALAARVARSGQ